jgi:hypothetical protein
MSDDNDSLPVDQTSSFQIEKDTWLELSRE